MAARTIHLVGSVSLADAVTVFRSCGSILGNLLKRYPDGETGSGRENRVQWLRPVAEEHPALELEPAVTSPSGEVARRYCRLKAGVRADDLTFAHVGYAAHAKSSYELFRRLRSEGAIPAAARPRDMRVLVELLNSVRAQLKRNLDFVHMLVPRGRSDEGYFLPLRDLAPHPETELVLGLVHYTDAVEGTRKRIATAAKIVADFTIAAECGFGRRPPGTILPLLEIHREAAQ